MPDPFGLSNSYGHSVPRIDGRLQQQGRAFRGELLAVERDGPRKTTLLELAGAYDVPGLTSVRRSFSLAAAGPQGGTLWLEDRIAFTNGLGAVEEAMLTWAEVRVGLEPWAGLGAGRARPGPPLDWRANVSGGSSPGGGYVSGGASARARASVGLPRPRRGGGPT